MKTLTADEIDYEVVWTPHRDAPELTNDVAVNISAECVYANYELPPGVVTPEDEDRAA